MHQFELKFGHKPLVAIMGLSFKPDIDDLRESPAKFIAQKVMQSVQNGFMIVEPNIREHNVFKLTDYREAYAKADIVAFLVAHKEFKTLEYNNEKIIFDFAGVFRNKPAMKI
jgi:UDP-N-acetyl-D-mannosaminuronic acid dehydrogenase